MQLNNRESLNVDGKLYFTKLMINSIKYNDNLLHT